jgi:hypothetical protein
MKGITTNIGRFAYSHPVQFNSNIVAQFGKPTSIKVKEDHLIITTSGNDQKQKLIQATELMGINIEVSVPRMRTETKTRLSRASQTSMKANTYKGIIFGVDANIDIDDIKNEADALVAYRMTKFIDGKREETNNVVLTFSEERGLPDNIYIGFLKFRVKQYIPHPFRCANCQRFGHGRDICYRKTCCPRCAGTHTFEQCPVTKEDEENIKCANCHANHSSAWTGCPKYKEVQKTIEISVTQKISYREALLKVKEKVANQDNTKGDTDQHKDSPGNDKENTEKETLGVMNGRNENTNENLIDDTRKIELSSVITKLNNLEAENEKLKDLLKFCLIGIIQTMEQMSEAEPEQQESTPNIYKAKLNEYAIQCGIDMTDVWQSPLPLSATSD